MFTGIIEEVGRVKQAVDLGGGRRFVIEAKMAGELRVDQSVCTNGVCLTVVHQDDHTFSVEAIEETLRKSTTGKLQVGDGVNLERAMQPHGRLDGHMVQGHVDSTGMVRSVTRETTGWLYQIEFDGTFRRFLIPVGSITVDGISLTIARLSDHQFTVAIIPHTYAHTTVETWRAGTPVNLEFDMIGKYVVGWLEQKDATTGQLTESKLREMGY